MGLAAEVAILPSAARSGPAAKRAPMVPFAEAAIAEPIVDNEQVEATQTKVEAAIAELIADSSAEGATAKPDSAFASPLP